MLDRRQFLAGAALAGAAATGLPRPARAAADWDATVAAAKGQSLNLIIDPYQAHKDVVAVFAQKFPGIDVQASTLHPSDAAPKMLTEQKNGVYSWDAWWGTCSNMNNVALPAGGLDLIDQYFVLPEVIEASNWRLPNLRYTSKRGNYVFVHTHFLINYGAYDKGQVPGGVLTLDNLTDPSLVGRISIRVPNRPHGGAMMLAQVAKEKGIGTVETILTTMKPMFVDNDRQNTMSVVRGDSAVGIGTSEETLYDCHQSGGCTNVVKFPVSVMHSRGISVPKNPPHKEAATVWVNWLLSKEGQEVFVTEWAKSNPGGALSMRKDVAPDPKHLESVPDFDNIDQYVAVALDSGWTDLKQIIDLYKKVNG
ncbi:extracellular solute-binding protein [Ancylobacter sp. MQZ15Z-1]|uniref:Extracellular solute-binding protein n=1 Tax=Ancylobacter mangrovi TaxID=2972472 RepID=A0A9X2PML7_9HYPH|nr:substrate-binding domain-containing protein [Ancylobacter mangrovi]MCS0496558.1 extracellular solute-binding protein [Ancylobacter mangrovi]